MAVLHSSIVVLLLNLHACASTQGLQPNIVFFLIDDFGHTDIGYHNAAYDNLLRTPNLDKLAAEGVKLEQYYVQPICTPSRSVLMSGRYQIHTGLQHGVIHPAQPNSLPTDIDILPNYLCGGGASGVLREGSPVGRDGLGYRCHLVGKWHLGFYKDSACPWNRGFHSTLGYLGGEEDYWDKMRNPGFDMRRDGAVAHDLATTVDGNASLYSTTIYRLRAIDIIEEHAAKYSDKPLFLYVPLQACHSPLQAPAFWEDKQAPLTSFNHSKGRRTYAAMVQQMDFAVGQVVTSLQEQGLYKNTVIVLSSDNGGIKPGGYNWPFRGQKQTLWEGGSRANGFVHSAIPGLLPETGFSYRGLMHVSDWLPTLLNLAGGDADAVSGLDGHDMWAAIAANETSPRSELLHNIDTYGELLYNNSYGFGDAAIRVGDLKLIVGNPGKQDGHFVPPGCNPTVCKQPVAPKGERCEKDKPDTNLWLFDIARDPLELCNLARVQKKDVKRLLAALGKYNDTAIPASYPRDDPASNPANRTGIEKGAWGPWKDDL